MALTTATGIIDAMTNSPTPKDQRTMAKAARNAATVMVVTMVAWMGLQVIGQEMGWAPRFALLVDLMAMAGFLWGLVTTYQIWRKRRA